MDGQQLQRGQWHLSDDTRPDPDVSGRNRGGGAVRVGEDKARQLVAAPSKFITTAVIAAVYVAAVIPFGFYTASLLLMLVLPVALGFRQWIYAVIVAVIFIAVVFLVFSVLLEKPLPREAIPPLLGLGG